MNRIVLIFLTICFLTPVGFSQENHDFDIFELSLEDLLNLEVSVGTKRATGIRETPGIVTVITEEDIQLSGARDLIDLFQFLVPGFDFGVDVEGVVGNGVRGLWAHEGKVLLMIDEQEVNDGMFGTIPYGNHFTLENIERIEIIRGPGSAIYGGFASLAVINIVTRKPSGSGGHATYLMSHTGKSFTHNNLSFGAHTNQNDLRFNITGVYGKGSRSDRDYIDYYGDSRSMQDASQLNVSNVNLQLGYKNFDFIGIVDDYHITMIDLWDEFYPGLPLDQRFNGYYSQAKYTFSINENLTIVPKINYKWQRPWNLNVPDDYNAYTNNKEFTRITGGVNIFYALNNNFNMLSGVEYSYDMLALPTYIHEYEETFKDGSNALKYSNVAAFAQGVLNTKFVNLTAGARFDKSSEFGNAFVPRIGLTKAFDKLHFKLMASQSFRVPGGILPNRIPQGVSGVTPEVGTNFEFEVGYRLPFNTWIIINGFDVSFKDVIVYGTTESGIGSYKNEGKIGTQGIETEIKHLSEKWTANLNFAIYKVNSSKTDEGFYVPGHQDVFLAFSPFRANAMIGYKPTKKVSIVPSVSYYGERYGFSHYDAATGTDVLTRYDPIALLNMNVRLKDVLTKNLLFELGVHNLLGSDFQFLAPYPSGHGSLPGLDRSFRINLGYSF